MVEASAPTAQRRPSSRRRRTAAAAVSVVGIGGAGTLVRVGIIPSSLAAISMLIIAVPVILAAVVFSVSVLFGIDPGPAGERLSDLVRDVLRLHR